MKDLIKHLKAAQDIICESDHILGVSIYMMDDKFRVNITNEEYELKFAGKYDNKCYNGNWLEKSIEKDGVLFLSLFDRKSNNI